MPKAIGSPISITGQKQRETIGIHITVTYDTDGTQHYEMSAIGEYRMRDNGSIGNIIWVDPVNVMIGPITDANITGALRAQLGNWVAKSDTL